MSDLAIEYYDSLEEVNIEELVDLFLKVDKEAVGDTYSTSTADMSREMFFDDEEVSNRDALQRFCEEYANELVVSVSDNRMIGFTFIWEGEPYFQELLPDYRPVLAVTFSGVDPEYQDEGVWSSLRDYISEEIVPNRDVEYIVTGAAEENGVSIKANKSRGFEEVGRTGDVEGDDTTVLLAKKV